MKDLIEVFRMSEISKETRARMIIKMGNMINMQYGSNLTEGIVFELVSILVPDHEILSMEHYKTAR